MAQEVTKRDGSKEPFDEGKISRSIKAAAEKADLAPDRVAEIMEEVSGSTLAFAGGKDEVSTPELREYILGELDRVEPAVSAAWRAHDEESGRG